MFRWAFVNLSARRFGGAAMVMFVRCAGLGCLLNATPAALIKVIEKLDTAKVGSHGWGPVVDGVRLVDTPLALVSAGRYNTKVPVLLGSNRDEMAYWSIASVDNQLTEAGFDEVSPRLALRRMNDPRGNSAEKRRKTPIHHASCHCRCPGLVPTDRLPCW